MFIPIFILTIISLITLRNQIRTKNNKYLFILCFVTGKKEIKMQECHTKFHSNVINHKALLLTIPSLDIYIYISELSDY